MPDSSDVETTPPAAAPALPEPTPAELPPAALPIIHKVFTEIADMLGNAEPLAALLKQLEALL